MVDKLNTYMLSGVREYWIVDPNKHSVLVYDFNNFEIDEYAAYKTGDVLIPYFFRDYNASGPLSPVRIRLTFSTGIIKIFPSPILPVRHTF